MALQAQHAAGVRHAQEVPVLVVMRIMAGGAFQFAGIERHRVVGIHKGAAGWCDQRRGGIADQRGIIGDGGGVIIRHVGAEIVGSGDKAARTRGFPAKGVEGHRAIMTAHAGLGSSRRLARAGTCGRAGVQRKSGGGCRMIPQRHQPVRLGVVRRVAGDTDLPSAIGHRRKIML